MKFAHSLSQLFVSPIVSKILFIHTVCVLAHCWVPVQTLSPWFYTPWARTTLSHTRFFDATKGAAEYWCQALCLLALPLHHTGCQCYHLSCHVQSRQLCSHHLPPLTLHTTFLSFPLSLFSNDAPMPSHLWLIGQLNYHMHKYFFLLKLSIYMEEVYGCVITDSELVIISQSFQWRPRCINFYIWWLISS